MASLRVATRLLALLRRDAKHLASVHSAAGSLLACLVTDAEAAPRLVASGGFDQFLDLLTDKAAPQNSKRLVRSAVGQLAGSVPDAVGGVWGWWTGQVGPSVRAQMCIVVYDVHWGCVGTQQLNSLCRHRRRW